MTNRALLLLDFQNDFFPGGMWPLPGIDEAASNARKVLRHARASGDVVIHVRHEFFRNDAPFCRRGSKGAMLHPDFASLPDEYVVVKHYVNAFRGTDLEVYLQANRVDDVVVCGTMSHLCVKSAACAAADMGFKVTVVQDACASVDVVFEGSRVPAQMVHATTMSTLKSGFGKLVTTTDFIERDLTAAPSATRVGGQSTGWIDTSFACV